MMRGEPELKTLIATLEEILSAVGTEGTQHEKLIELGGRHEAAVDCVRQLFEEPGLSAAEQSALEPLMVHAGRLNALASSSASREQGRVGTEIDKVRRAADHVRRRRGATSGRSCDLSG